MKVFLTRRLKVSATICALVAGLLGLAGCASSNSVGTNTTSSSSPTTGQGGDPIKLAVSPWPSWFLWYVAEEKGFFKQHNVKVQLVWFPVYSDSLQAFATGQVDANCQTLSDTLVPVSKGVPLKAVLVNDNSAGGDGVVAKNGINSIEDLKGKTVATELGTVDHMLLETALHSKNMSDADIQFTNMTVNDAGPAFISGKVDAAVLWEPFLDKAVAEGKGHIIFSSKDTPGLIPDLLVVSKKTIDTHKTDVQSIVAAWFDALKFWQEHPQEAESIMAKHANTTPAEFHESVKVLKIFSANDNLKAFQPGNTYESLAYSGTKTAEFLQRLGMISKMPNMNDILDDEFVKNLNK